MSGLVTKRGLVLAAIAAGACASPPAVAPAPAPASTPPVEGGPIVAIAASNYHVCAVAKGGGVWCWGDPGLSRLGVAPRDVCVAFDGARFACALRPTRVPGIDAAIDVTAAADGTCALLRDGRAKCWGANHFGAIGAATTDTCDGAPCARAPTAVAGLADLRAIDAGWEHTCAIRADATATCWGEDRHGQLGAPATDACGSGAIPCARAPRPVGSLAGVASIAAGATHTCARTQRGDVFCWGGSEAGQLGMVPADRCWDVNYPCATAPAKVPGLPPARAIAVGEDATFALDERIHPTVTIWLG
jgi:alpha-tubulin suppressor-like RCC1 family protein